MESLFTEEIAAITPKVIAWRRHFHEYPEASFEEFETTNFIIENIKDLPGITYERLSKTGIVAKMDTGRPGPTIAMRADIDALRMKEESGVPFSSKNEGVMHSCGHDAHTAMLMGAMHVMSAKQKDLQGKFVFIFQAAEEDPPGGAKELVEKGVMDGVDAVIGQHLASLCDLGVIEVNSGYNSANTDTFRITINGVGGHGSRPQLCLDPIPAGAQIVTALQTIVSRNIPAKDAVVLSVTYFQSGTAHNIIPDQAVIRGTVRSFDADARDLVEAKIASISNGIAESFGLTAKVEYNRGYDAVYNTPEYTERLIEMAEGFYGKGIAVERGVNMGGEDFSAYLGKAPGCFYHIGSASDKLPQRYLGHNSHYIIDEDVLPIGINLITNGALLFQKIVQEKK